jgi:hypothetical protein
MTSISGSPTLRLPDAVRRLKEPIRWDRDRSAGRNCGAVGPPIEPRGATVSRHLRIFVAAVLGPLVLSLLSLPTTAGASPRAQATLDAYFPTRTSFTGIDPGAGQYYSYAPSTVQTSASTRYVFYCGNSPEGDVKDHVWLSVGHTTRGQWRYSTPRIVLGPAPGTFFAVHTCEPDVVGGNFRFGGTPYRWAMFFTAEAVASNSTNVIGVAFANSLSGPWRADLTPFVQTAADFGNNSYPNDCPIDKTTGQTLYCLGEPAVTTIGGGKLLLTYMGNSGSPGNDSNPSEGLVLREVNLSNVPRTGACARCFLTLPDGNKVEAVTQTGLQAWPHDASIAYVPSTRRVVMSFDNGPYNTSPNGAPVTPVVTEATIGVNGLLDGNGTWTLQGSFGQCLSGYTLNHNSGIVRNSAGDLPSSGHLEVLYAMANANLGTEWGVWDYRLWDVSAPLTGGPGGPSVAAASTSCPGLTAVTAAGQVTADGSAHDYGSVAAPGPKAPIAGMALTPDRHGYYLVTTTGQVLAFGDATNQGSLRAGDSAPVVGIAVDPVTGGYWIARSDGTVVGVGAPTLGSFGLTATTGSVVGMVGIPNGAGYYLATVNGYVGAFGHALNYGNLAVHAGQSVATIATTPDGLGYYLVTKGGTIATFGNAQLFGPAVVHLSGPVAAMAVSIDGFGYWVAASTGVVTAFGDASATLAGRVPGPSPVVALATS